MILEEKNPNNSWAFCHCYIYCGHFVIAGHYVLMGILSLKIFCQWAFCQKDILSVGKISYRAFWQRLISSFMLKLYNFYSKLFSSLLKICISSSEAIYLFLKSKTDSLWIRLFSSTTMMLLLLFLCYQAKRRLDRCLTTIYYSSIVSAQYVFFLKCMEKSFPANIDLSVWLICMGKHNVLKRRWQLLYRL